MAMASARDLPWQQLSDELRAFVRRRVRNEADVDDLVQRVLLQIFKSLDSLRDVDRVHAWVYRTARNTIIDYYRAAGARVDTPAGDAVDVAADVVDDGRVDGAVLQELAGCMAPMMQQLDPSSREALALAEFGGLTQREAAERAGITVSGMKSRVQRGRRQLKAVFEACCRIELDRRGGIAAFERQSTSGCEPCSECD